MDSTSVGQNNRRIAKNTFLLYLRMFFAMAVSLYTSRIVLAQLGIVDFGIYNVVGGFVTIFAVINSAMTGSTQRFLTIELGRNNSRRLHLIFNTSMQIHLLISVIVVIVAEIAGLWFMQNKMQIPSERMDAAYWVFQFSVLSMVVSFVNVPYTALIIAYEKMGAFAYISVLEVLLKLASAFLLMISPIEKLKFYAILMFACPLVVRFCYMTYCNRHFVESKLKMVFDKGLFKEMAVFASWGLFGQLAGVGMTQGVNVLLNMFFGPVVNAARGVAVQVQGAVSQFALNFQTAVNPQITKTYAGDNLEEMHRLICRSAKFSFILLFAIGLPLIIEAPVVLGLWLKQVPANTVPFLRIILLITIVDSVANPMMVAAAATGKIKRYQTAVGGLLLLVVPLAYAVLKLGAPPISVFIVHFIICIIAFVARLYIVAPLTKLRPIMFFRNVVFKCVCVAAVSFVISYGIYVIFPKNTICALLICIMTAVIVCMVSYLIGLSREERQFAKKIVQRIVKR